MVAGYQATVLFLIDMRIKSTAFIGAVAAAFLGASLAHGQGTGRIADPSPITAVALANVEVRAHGRPLVLRAPGTARGLHDAYASSITPGRQVAVWHPTPDSGRTYRIRAVRVRLGARLPDGPTDLLGARRVFDEGCLGLRLSPATPTGEPAETNLLPALLLLTPAAAARHAHGWVRFDVQEQRLVLPATGVFVVAQGLPTPNGDQYVRSRTLVREPNGRTPPEDLSSHNRRPNGKGTSVFLYEEVQPAGGGAPRLVPTHAFPAVAIRSLAPADEARSWQWYRFSRDKAGQWTTIQQTNTRIKTTLPTAPPVRDYNYDLELEVEEL